MDLNQENVGAALLALRSEKKLSRRTLVEELGGKPWSSGRIGDLEKGKHPWSYFRPVERARLLDWLERAGYGVAELSADAETPTERTAPATGTAAVEAANGHLVYGDDGQGAIPLLTEDDLPRLLEPIEIVVGAAPPTPETVSLPPLQPGWEGQVDRTVVAMAVESVQARLAGKPAPFPFPTLYRVDTAPPSDLERIMKWCERVHQWLDELDTGRATFQPAGEGSTAPAYGQGPPVVVEQEVLDRAAAHPTGLGLPTGSTGAAALSVNGLRRLTNSELQTFKHCRRRWWLSWYRGLRLKAEPTGGVRGVGTWVHDALAQYYVPEGQTPKDPRLAFDEITQAAELELLQATASLEDAVVAGKVADFQKDADLGRAMLEGYVEWLAETGADVGLRVVAPEEVLTAVLECSNRLTVQVQGRLDVRLQRDADLVRLFMDHKTVGNFTDPARRLPMDEQMRTYLLLEQAQGEGAGYVDGAIYNMLRRVKRSPQAKPPFYERLEVRHNPTTVATFRERLKGQALTIDLVERSLDEGVDPHLIAYPTPSSRCTWGCEFFALCPMFDDGSRAEDFVSEHYVTVNPLDRYDYEETTL